MYGNWVQVTDGHRKYARAPVGDNFPLAMWSNRWSTMPIRIDGFDTLPKPDGRAELARMPGSDVPVIRQPFVPGDRVPFWAAGPHIVDQHHCYDLDVDPDESENRRDESIERELVELLQTALREIDAPSEQFERLGLA